MKKARTTNIHKTATLLSMNPEKTTLLIEIRWKNECYYIIAQQKRCTEQKLWNDNGSWFEAPTIRELTDMAASTAIAIATFGQSAFWELAGAAALNLIDDAVFAVADGASGAKSWAEAGFGFGMKALTAAATFGIQQIGAGIMGEAGTKVVDEVTGAITVEGATGLMAKTGFEGLLARTAFTGAQTWTQSIVQGAIGGITYSDDDGFGYNYAALGSAMYGNQTGADVFGSMAQSLVSGTSNALLAGDGTTDHLLGFNVVQRGGVATLGSLMGGLASSAVQYGMTGSATFNVFNFADIGGIFGQSNWARQGLLELTVGEDAGMRIGSGGTDVSAGTLGMAMLGLWTVGKNWDIDKFCEDGGPDAKIAYRAQYGYGDEDAIEQMDGILDGSIKLGQQNFTDPTTDAQSVTSESGQKSVLIEMLQSGLSVKDQLKLALILQHEAKRDGLTKTEEEGDIETQDAVKAHSAMALALGIDEGLGKSMINLINTDFNLNQDVSHYYTAVTSKKSSKEGSEWDEFNKYVDENYDSSADFWKYNVDAKSGKTFWTWDGSYDFDLTAIGLGVVSAEQFLYAASILQYSDKQMDSRSMAATMAKNEELMSMLIQASEQYTDLLSGMQTISNFNKVALEFESAIWDNEKKPLLKNGRVITNEDERMGEFAKELSALMSTGLVLKQFNQDIASHATSLYGSNLVAPVAQRDRAYSLSSLWGIRLLGGILNDHNGIDISGRNIRLIAMGDGNVTYDWDGYGNFRAVTDTTITGMAPSASGEASPAEVSLRVSMLHLGAESAKAMIGLAFTQGVSMSYSFNEAKLAQTQIAFSGVQRGYTIGYSGATGWSTGPHTHLSMYLAGSAVDPRAFLKDLGFDFEVSAAVAATSGFQIDGGATGCEFMTVAELGEDPQLKEWLYNALSVYEGFDDETKLDDVPTDYVTQEGEGVAYLFYLNAVSFGWDQQAVLDFLKIMNPNVAAATKWWYKRAADIVTAKQAYAEAEAYGLKLPPVPLDKYGNKNWFLYWQKYGSLIEQMIEDAIEEEIDQQYPGTAF